MFRFFFTSFVFFLLLVLLSVSYGAAGFQADADILWTVRLPRVVTALGCGAAVAIAGALSQSMFRNALATPSITGTEAGAAFALATATVLMTKAGNTLPYPALFTSVGAACATLAALVFMRLSAHKQNGLGHLLLGGFALNALLSAGTSLCISLLMEDGDGMTLFHWLMGSFSARTWTDAAVITAGVSVGGAFALKQSSALDALCLGDESARMIGISVQRERIKLILVISLLVGVSLSVGGALPFVGLIAPHFARLMIGPYVKTLIPASALFGASLTLAADLIARTARAPIDMDVGIITTIIGAPYFLWLLMRRSSL